jgi:hypothetical protein
MIKTRLAERRWVVELISRRWLAPLLSQPRP